MVAQQPENRWSKARKSGAARRLPDISQAHENRRRACLRSHSTTSSCAPGSIPSPRAQTPCCGRLQPRILKVNYSTKRKQDGYVLADPREPLRADGVVNGENRDRLFQRLRPHGQTREAVEAGADGGASASVKVFRIDLNGDLPGRINRRARILRRDRLRQPDLHGRRRVGSSKKFATSKSWYVQALGQDRRRFHQLASVNGDKAATISWLMTFAMQHRQIWIGTGLLPSNKSEHGRSTSTGRRACFSPCRRRTLRREEARSAIRDRAAGLDGGSQNTAVTTRG